MLGNLYRMNYGEIKRWIMEKLKDVVDRIRIVSMNLIEILGGNRIREK